MREWLVIQQFATEASRARVLAALVRHRWSAAAVLGLLVGIVLATASLVAIISLAQGLWRAAALAVAIPVLGLLGALALEERAVAVFQSRRSALHLNRLLRRYRRGFFGARYVLFMEILRDTGYFSREALETALHCCDAELAMRQAGHPRVRGTPAVVAALTAVALSGAVPWLTPYGFGEAAGTAGLALAVIALPLVAWRGAQPRLAPTASTETRTMLVWALEEARAEEPGKAPAVPRS